MLAEYLYYNISNENLSKYAKKKYLLYSYFIVLWMFLNHKAVLNDYYNKWLFKF